MMTILNRLREASTGSRELDTAIFKFEHPEYADYVNGRGGLVHPCDGQDQRVLSDVRPEPLTTSIDAALTLVDRMLPEANCVGFDKTPLRVDAYVSRNNVKSGHWCEDGWHKSSVPLAILTALFTALEKEQP